MYVAVKIETKNDSSGNPRRGWIVTDVREGQEYAVPPVFVPENYHGKAALDREFPSGVVVVATVTVTPGEYRDRVRGVGYRA